MNTPQRFTLLLLINLLLGMGTIHTAFKICPKIYRLLQLPFLQARISKMQTPPLARPMETNQKLEFWFEKHSRLIQKQVEEPAQMELQLQGDFKDLLQSFRDLPPGSIQSAEIQKENTGLCVTLVLKKS